MIFSQINRRGDYCVVSSSSIILVLFKDIHRADGLKPALVGMVEWSVIPDAQAFTGERKQKN